MTCEVDSFQLQTADNEGFFDRRLEEHFNSCEIRNGTKDTFSIIPEIAAGDEGMFDRREFYIELAPSVPHALS